MDWVTANWQLVVEVLLASLGLFSVIAKFTKTESDNKIADKLLKVVHLLGLTKKASKKK